MRPIEVYVRILLTSISHLLGPKARARSSISMRPIGFTDVSGEYNSYNLSNLISYNIHELFANFLAFSLIFAMIARIHLLMHPIIVDNKSIALPPGSIWPIFNYVINHFDNFLAQFAILRHTSGLICFNFRLKVLAFSFFRFFVLFFVRSPILCVIISFPTDIRIKEFMTT
jgi:hypothetical protein